jgi:hypothetical protein
MRTSRHNIKASRRNFPRFIRRGWPSPFRALAAMTRGIRMSWDMQQEPRDSPSFAVQLLEVVREFQEAYKAWELAIEEEERKRRRATLTDVYARLWPMLMHIVEPLARKWALGHRIEQQLSSDWEQTVLSLCTNYCLSIIDELPRKEVNPEKNIVALFRAIAFNQMVDEHRRYKRHEGAAAADSPEPGAKASAPARRTFTTRPLDDEILRTVPDEFSGEAFERLDAADYNHKLAEAIRAYWRGTLSGDEHLIVELRVCDPPVPYDSIASQLGPNWTAESVRQRFSRLRRRTLQHLRAIGLLADL